jgi:hypothetical protein
MPGLKGACQRQVNIAASSTVIPSFVRKITPHPDDFSNLR